jgi:methyl-accepting chemotaxis protein
MGSGFEISVKDVQQAVAALNGLLSDFDGSIREVSSVTTPTGSFGQVGSAAAVSSKTTQDQLVATLQALTSSLKQLNHRVEASARNYSETDAWMAEALASTDAAKQATGGQPGARIDLRPATGNQHRNLGD